MAWLGELWRRFRFLLHRRQVERDLDEEIRLHKELRQKRYRITGTGELAPEEPTYAGTDSIGAELIHAAGRPWDRYGLHDSQEQNKPPSPRQSPAMRCR